MALNAGQLLKGLPGFFTVAEATTLDEGEIFTITGADMEEVGQGAKAEDKPVLSFAQTKKKLVLNKGRCTQLTDLFGNDELVGKNISLAVENIGGREQIIINGVD